MFHMLSMMKTQLYVYMPILRLMPWSAELFTCHSKDMSAKANELILSREINTKLLLKT